MTPSRITTTRESNTTRAGATGSRSPSTPVPAIRLLRYFIALTQARTKLRFHFTADGAWSDQDGLYNTDGGCIIDSIRVIDNRAALNNYENFESAAVGATSAGIWIGLAEPAYGSYTRSQEQPDRQGSVRRQLRHSARLLPRFAEPELELSRPLRHAVLHGPRRHHRPVPERNRRIAGDRHDEVLDRCNNVQDGTIPAGRSPAPRRRHSPLHGVPRSAAREPRVLPVACAQHRRRLPGTVEGPQLRLLRPRYGLHLHRRSDQRLHRRQRPGPDRPRLRRYVRRVVPRERQLRRAHAVALVRQRAVCTGTRPLGPSGATAISISSRTTSPSSSSRSRATSARMRRTTSTRTTTRSSVRATRSSSTAASPPRRRHRAPIRRSAARPCICT